MAKQINDDGVYVFDQDHIDSGSLETPTPMFSILRLLQSRYTILGIAFWIFALSILIMTATLQFSGNTTQILASYTGVSRQYNVKAPRGDIIDRNDIVLATSEEVNILMLANAKLGDEKLNAMLLDLSYLLDQYNVTPVYELAEYLQIDPYLFLKDQEKTLAWQISPNLFGLEESTTNSIVSFSDDYVKLDPQIFFLYLRSKEVFNISTEYSEEEAYRIALLRYQIYAARWAFQTGTPVKIATDVPDELITYLLEQNNKYFGIIAAKEYRRVYSPLAETSSSVVGYIGKISQETYSSLKNFGYSADDIVGQQGIEAQMERYLHGQAGIEPYNVWTTEEEAGMFFPETIGVEPLAGANVRLTIDTRLQKVALDALKEYIEEAAKDPEAKAKGYKTASGGAVVMLDVKTGEILTMVSYPNFDPMDFVLTMEGDAQAHEQVNYYLGLGDYSAITEEDKPLFNRAIQAYYAPGSTFKMVTAVAGLEKGVISGGSNTYICESPYEIDAGFIVRCLEKPEGGHGPLTLEEGLATSCNVYFQRLGVDTGIDAIDYWGKILGLGELTGIDLPGEIKGFRASKEIKRLLREKEYDKTWFIADTAQSSIGQFDNSFTIIQLARYTAALATNTLVTPHIIKEVTSPDGTTLYTGSTYVEQLNLSDSTLDAVRKGMLAVGRNELGTAYNNFKDFPILVGCKTGTAETGFEDSKKEYSNGLFVVYAPYDDPQVAIALVVDRGEWGSSTTVIAKKLLMAYFGVAESDKNNITSSDASIGDVPVTTPSPTPEASETTVEAVG